MEQCWFHVGMDHKLPMKQTIFWLMDIQNYQQFFGKKKSFAPSQKRAQSNNMKLHDQSLVFLFVHLFVMVNSPMLAEYWLLLTDVKKTWPTVQSDIRASKLWLKLHTPSDSLLCFTVILIQLAFYFYVFNDMWCIQLYHILMIRYVLLKMSARAMVSCVFRSKVEQHPKPGRCTEPTEFGAAYLYHMEEYMIGIYI